MVEQVRNTINKIVQTSGRSFLSILFPNDVESYFVSLELCDGETDETLSLFTFPVNPDSFVKKEPYAFSVKKTFGGLVVNESVDDIPQDLTIKGNFGRSLKLLTGNYVTDLFGISLEHVRGESQENRNQSTSTPTITRGIPNFIKTGYGCTKYLQRICQLAKMTDGENRIPRNLYFHNHILGESYLIKVKSLQIEQSMNTNMIHNYTLQMTCLGLALQLSHGKFNKQTLANRLLVATTQAVTNQVAGSAIKIARNIVQV